MVVVYSINKFCHYITGYEVFVHTDHSAIIFLMNKPITNGIVTWWLLLLQEVNITVIDRPGKENLVANFLSRIQHDDDAKPVDHTFPNENLFAVCVQTPWFSYISNYSWVGNDLFYTGPDLIIRRCVREDEMTDIFHACHDGPCGGHFFDKRMTYKLLRSGY